MQNSAVIVGRSSDENGEIFTISNFLLSMKKQIIIQILGLFIVSNFTSQSELNAQNTSEKPNILMIFIDDMGWPSVSCLGNQHVKTKNIDKIADEGMLFTDAYVNPQCTPSRASLLTGQHTARNRFWHVIGRYGYPYMRMDEPPYEENLSRDAYTLAEMLQDNGYRTSINGKWHLHTWNERYPNPDGYYTFLFDHAKAYYGWDYNSIPDNINYHQTGEKGVNWLTDEAIKVIDQKDEKPFFIYLSQHTIHGPVLAPEELVKKYLKMGYPENGVFNATYLAAIEHMDNAVGRLLDHLDKKGKSENTLVIFLTDNGGVDMEFANDPLRYGKGSMYEGGIRVPMMVKWPGKIEQGSVCKTPVHIIDIYPTLLEIAGGKMEQDWILDGISLMPLLSQKNDLSRESLFWYMPLYDAAWGATPCAVIRKGNYKLIEFFGDYCDREDNWKYIPEGRTELFNLAEDIGETTDLSKEFPNLTKSLKEELYAWIQDMDAPLPILNTRYDSTRLWERTQFSLNFRPILENEIPDKEFKINSSFSFTIDSETFKEYDNEKLNFFTCLEGGEVLPSWLSFDEKAMSFSGISEQEVRLIIEVKAIDPQGASASDQFELKIY